MDSNNPQRVIRALEVCLETGRPFSSFLNHPKAERPFHTMKIGLTAPREKIYERINQRVDMMMDEGLLEEAHKLYHQRKLNPLNTVGYKELFAFLEGRTDLEQAVEEIKKNTRRFAKRQLTWFRKEQDIHWFEHTTPVEDIVEYINNLISKNSSGN
jgi:tRNA dimethylallyltransferase